MANLVLFVVLIALVEIVSLNPTLSSAIAFFVGLVLNYICQYKITFKSQDDHTKTFFRFSLVAMLGMLINLVLFWSLNEQLGFPYVVAQFVAIGSVVIINYNVNKRYTFRTSDSVQ